MARTRHRVLSTPAYPIFPRRRRRVPRRRRAEKIGLFRASRRRSLAVACEKFYNVVEEDVFRASKKCFSKLALGRFPVNKRPNAPRNQIMFTPDPSKWNLCQDPIFRAFFGGVDSAPQTRGLVNAALKYAGRPLAEKLEILNPYQPIEKLNDDETFLDDLSSDNVIELLATEKNGRAFNIEMATYADPAFFDQIIYRSARVFSQQELPDDEDEELQPVIGIAFLDFPLDPKRPDLWFDVWRMASEINSGFESKELTIICIQLPKQMTTEIPQDCPDIQKWTAVLKSARVLSKETLDSLQSVDGMKDLRKFMNNFVGSSEEIALFEANHEYRKEVARLSALTDQLTWERDEAKKEAEFYKLRDLETQRSNIGRLIYAYYRVKPEESLPSLIDKSYEELEKLSEVMDDIPSYEEFQKLL